MINHKNFFGKTDTHVWDKCNWNQHLEFNNPEQRNQIETLREENEALHAINKKQGVEIFENQLKYDSRRENFLSKNKQIFKKYTKRKTSQHESTYMYIIGMYIKIM